MSNSLTANEVVSKEIGELVAERKQVDLKIARGNKALYGLLGKCLDLHHKCNTDEDYADCIAQQYSQHKTKVQANTSLALKICKLVFGLRGDPKKASAYAKVLGIACDAGETGKTLPGWISKKGGIEKIRLMPDEEAQKRQKAKLEKATAALGDQSGFAVIKHLPCNAKPGDVVPMLGIVESDLTVKVVHFIDNKKQTLAGKLVLSHESVTHAPSPVTSGQSGEKTSVQKIAESAKVAA